MTPTPQTDAQRLADNLRRDINQTDADDQVVFVARWTCEETEAELRRLDAVEKVADDLQDICDKQALKLAALEAERDQLRGDVTIKQSLLDSCVVEMRQLRAQVERLQSEDREVTARSQKLFAPLLKAVIELLAAVDERHDTKDAPLKYTVPYGALNALRASVGMVPSIERLPGGEPVAWPSTPRDIRNFIGSQAISMEFANAKNSDDLMEFENAEPSEDDKYYVSAHDLLSAFRDWTDAQPAVPTCGSQTAKSDQQASLTVTDEPQKLTRPTTSGFVSVVPDSFRPNHDMSTEVPGLTKAEAAEYLGNRQAFEGKR